MLAWVTVVPARLTGGSNVATGVSSPNLPMWNSTAPSFVVPCSASNLNARAHFGTFAVYPMRSRCAQSFTFTTMPSVS